MQSTVAPPAVSMPVEAPSRRSGWSTLAVLSVTVLIVNLDNTVLNVALPTLVRDLQATDSQLQWIVDAYALVFAGLLLVAGSLADRVGRKRTFMVGLAAFAGASAWAAFSGSVGVLIAARASMGVGAALMMPSTLSIITDVFPDQERRQRAIGVWAGTSGVGFALGPIVGGFLLTHFWWGSVFLINVPVVIVGLLLAIALVPDSKNPAALRPDVVGALLSMSGLGLVLWSIIEAPVRGWTSGWVLASGFVGLAVIAAFVMWERSSSHPMLNLRFFRAGSFSGAIGSVGLLMFGLVGSLFLLTQYLQFELGYSALQAGLRMLPVAAALAVVSPLSPFLVRALGTRRVAAVGLAVVAFGLWQISRSTIGWSYQELLPGMVTVGIGGALVMPTVTGSVMSSLPPGDTGVGSATNGVFIQVGGALGVAVVGSLLATRYQDHMTVSLAGLRLPAAVHQAVLGSVGGALEAAARVGGATGVAIAREARVAFISGSGLGMLVAAAVAIAAAALAAVVLPRRLRAPRG